MFGQREHRKLGKGDNTRQGKFTLSPGSAEVEQ